MPTARSLNKAPSFYFREKYKAYNERRIAMCEERFFFYFLKILKEATKMEIKWNDDGTVCKERDNSSRQRRIDILDLAKGVITNDRNKTYGEPENIFPLIAEYWSTYLRESLHDADIYVSDTDVAVMMALMKIARIMENPGHTDSYVDAIGYLAIAQTLE